ncbi:hypothetical protein CSKR_201273 [Clonorchis sinensis]|uniref:Uncharacterized protein n=1 Tax=Clonorchis sinensis TaxID=79923 RepID=A0A419PHV7_CLOSI|nr:hypothetical protein CSKR_201273 [Clonorchis sinensis]
MFECSFYKPQKPIRSSNVFKNLKLLAKYTRLQKNWFCERLTQNSAESPVYDVSKQLNVLHQVASCFSWYDIRGIAINICKICMYVYKYMYRHNALLIRLLKILRQPTTGFALLRTHQNNKVFEKYTHLQINLVFARDSPGTLLNFPFVMFSGN